jgi:ABC-2 family transporter protein
MNPFIKKEIRLLLPAFAIACVLTLANLFFQDEPNSWGKSIWYFVSRVVCPAVAVMLALSTFGEEVSNGTFSMLLAQPVSRLKIWQTKIGLLAGALLLVTLLWVGSFALRIGFISHETHAFKDWLDFFAVTITFGLVIFSGGLWTVLLLRQVAAAFWFTLLMPGVILMILTAFFGDGDSNFFEGLVVTVLGLYSLGGFFFARRLFLRAQDVQWSGGTIVLPEMRRQSRARTVSDARRTWRPRAVLWCKEMLLHQSQFVMAFALVVLHLVVLAVRKFCNLDNSPDLKFVLEQFWLLWLVMPLLVGCAAIAEERKLGTLASQLCLPVKRRTQFGIKFLVVLELAILFGVVMPLLLEGTKICPGLHFRLANGDPYHQLVDSLPGRLELLMLPIASKFILSCLVTLNGFLPLLTLVIPALVISAVAFYISSFARNTLQTLAPTALGLLLVVFLFVAANSDFAGFLFQIVPLWSGSLLHLIGVPVLGFTLVALTSHNFKQTAVGWRTYGRNGLTWIVTLLAVLLATGLIYNRAWEKLTPFEPPHGQARLTLSNPATMRSDWNKFYVRLPDGRIWEQDCYMSGSPEFSLNGIKMVSPAGHFYDGSNWINVIQGGKDESEGIKTDGTLWVATNSPPHGRMSQFGQLMAPITSGNWVQFGANTNWYNLWAIGVHVLLAKTDGTLWRWGPETWTNKLHEWPGLRAFTPERSNGGLWAQSADRDREHQDNLRERFNLALRAFPQNGQWRGTAIVTMIMSFNLGVRSDGTFRILADQQPQKIKKRNEYELVWTETDSQIGKDTNWLALASSHNKVVTLKGDGTLWLWNFHYDGMWGTAVDRIEKPLLATTPVRLGIHSDWISVASAGSGVISLAADGSLWYWPLENPNHFGLAIGMRGYTNEDPLREPLLKMSGKPQFLGNIFGGNN